MIFWQNLQIISSCGVDFKSNHRTISCPIAAMPLFDLWHLSWKVNIEVYGIHSHNGPLVTFLPTRRIARVCVLFVSSLWLFLSGWLTEFLFLLFCFALFVCFILVFSHWVVLEPLCTMIKITFCTWYFCFFVCYPLAFRSSVQTSRVILETSLFKTSIWLTYKLVIFHMDLS